MTKKQKQQYRLSKLVDRRIEKLLDKLKVYDSTRRIYKEKLINRYTNKSKSINKNIETRRYSELKLKQIDINIRYTNTKKFINSSNVKKLQKIMGQNSYREFKNKFELNDKEWRKKLKEVNEMEWYDITDKYLSDTAEWYFENREDIIQYNKNISNDDKKFLNIKNKKLFKDYTTQKELNKAQERDIIISALSKIK